MYFPLICRNIMVLRWGICGAGLICSDFVSAVLAPPNNGHEVKRKKIHTIYQHHVHLSFEHSLQFIAVTFVNLSKYSKLF